MKKLLLILMALFLWAGSSWAVTVQIGSGTTTTSYFPIYTCYGYSYSQQIYLASEISGGGGGAGQINKIRFFYSSGGTTFANWASWDIYLGNTTKTTFTSTSDWVPVGSMTQVFSGIRPTPVAGTWLEITLTTPFSWDGTSNLVVAVDENTAGYSCTAAWRSFASGSNRGIEYYSDGTNPNPATPPTANYGPNATLAQIQFDMPAAPVPPNCTSAVSPLNLATGVLPSATLNWNVAGGATGYKLYFGTSPSPAYIGDLGNILTYNPSPDMNYSTTYYWSVTPYNTYGEPSGCPVWSFTTGADPTIIGFPYTESFDGTTFAPYGWTNLKTAGTALGLWDRVTTGTNPTCTPHSGAGMARYYAYSYAAGTQGILVSPPINFANDFYKVDFWMYRDNGYPTNADLVRVYYNSANNLTGATLLGTINRSRSLSPVEAADGWYNYSFYMPTGAGGNGRYVIFEGVSAYGNNIFVDDVTLNSYTPTYLSWYNLQWPLTATIEGYQNETIYAQCWEPGVTDLPGQGPNIQCWIGYSTTNTDPSTWTNWVPAVFNVDAGNNDEYMASLGYNQGLAAGTYYYASRFFYLNGPYTYGGTGGPWGGSSVSGVLTINPPVNDECSAVTPVTLVDLTPTLFTGNNAGATISCPSGPFNSYGEVWEAFTLTYPANVVLNYCGSGGGTPWGNAWLNLMTSCPCGGVTAAATYNTTACGDGNVTMTWTALAAGTYYYPVMFAPAFNSKGVYNITITATYFIPPANDLCSGAITMACGNSYNGTTTNATPDAPGACNAANYTYPGVWYHFAGIGDMVSVDLCTGTTWDSQISVYSGTCSSLTCVDGNDDYCGLYSRMDWFAETGVDYYILVHQYGTTGGAFTLTVNCTYPATATWDGGDYSDDWFGADNWDVSDVPGTTTNVVIPTGLSYYPTVDRKGACNNISVASGARLVDRGTGYLIPGASATVDQNYLGGEWHLISAPVNGATANMFLGLYLQKHTESTNLYTDITIPTTPLNVMQGYALWNDLAGTASFVGTLNTGAFGLGLTRNGQGWNLVGNPYASPIDWNAVTGWTKTNVDNATYRHVNNATWASYVGGVGANGGTQYIAPNQGFFVGVTSGFTLGTLSMTNDVRTHSTAPFFKDEIADIVRLEITGNGFTDETVIRFLNVATPEFDGEWDAHKLFGIVPEAAAIYSADNDMMAINSLPETNTVPVGVKAGVPGEFTITATETSEFTDVILEDLLTGTITDLKSNSYTFSYDMNFDNRFIVHFTPLAVGENAADLINIYSSQKDVYVSVPANTEGDIVVYNLMGQEVARTVITDVVNKITLEKSAYYVVKVMSNENVVTEKVFVK